MMTGYFSSIGPAVANHLWQSTMFAVTVWLVTLLLRRNPARVRFSLWLVASVKFLLPFSLLVGLGSLLPRPQRVVTVAPAAVYLAMDAVGLPFSGDVLPMEGGIRQQGTGNSQTLLVVLAAVWFCGVVVVVLVWFARWLQVHAMLRRAELVENGREAKILRRLESVTGAHRRLPLLLSRDLMEPGIFGVFRPVLIWPERLSEKLEDEHIKAIVAHELEHVRRRDNLAAVLHMAVEAAFWFHPMVWWMERRMVEERERACDEVVVQMGGSAETYAESLLKACRFCVESPLVCVAGITGADLKMRIQAIMRLRLERLGFGRKALLAVVGVAVVAGPVLFGAMHATQVRAQTEDMGGKAAAFDVVSIKPHPAGGIISMIGMEVTSDEVHGVYMTVPMMIGIAYGIQSDDMVSGAPGWAKNERVDFTGKMSEADIAIMKTLNKTEQKARRNQMLRAMLAERFHLKVHRATKQVPVYELVAAKEGTKIQEGTAETNPHPIKGPDGKPVTLGMIRFYQKEDQSIVQAYSMKAFADFLTQPAWGLGRPVVDKTGLTGTYNFELHWVPTGSATATNDSVSPEAGASLVTALKEVGLRLQPSTGPVETVVIDHVERPAGDAGGEVPQARDVPAQALATVSASNATKLSFSVATVKPSSKDMVGMFSESAESFLAKGFSIENLIAYAYDIPWAQGLSNDPQQFWPRPPNLLGGPAWVHEDTFDIAAKADDATVQAWNKLPPGQRKEQLRLMLRSLLEDRFKLTMRQETRVVPAYALVVAKGGAKVMLAAAPPVPADPKVWTQPWKLDKGLIGGSAVTMSALAEILRMNREIGSRKVIDQTGLTGKYDFTLKWSPQEDSATDESTSPSLFTAIQEQLGLKLVPTKAPMDLLVIDHVERPSEN